MAIVPDTKDWTWVIDRPCPECGFDASEYRDADVAPAIRATAATWSVVLDRSAVRKRPNEATWSPLEYGAHVRDVLAIYRERVGLMLTEDDPLYANWDQDATAIADRYNEQESAVVAAELVAAGGAIAELFESVDQAGWSRPGRRSDGAQFTVSTISRYLLHDLVHHQHDVNG